ncbi:DUF3515 domain-containing protein [Nakamurella flava]|uniref:DUF3515 domain-containing protein n=1 Tax=Nakamurella flava TaxID=2576308 RepID=A0A4U6QMN2_9ACTN|nr:DUF3515 domain-containing protein [Nakamurella flava]TKV61428.1 DUF3515 domain-containing protein [Nakamurella flava]
MPDHVMPDDAERERRTRGGSVPESADDRPPAWRLIAAIAVGVLAVVAVIVGSVVARSASAPDPNAPLALGPVPAPGAADPACVALMRALPDQLAGLDRRTVSGLGALPDVSGSATSAPADQADLDVGAVAAWGEPPVVLRCGVQTPTELTCSAPVQVVDGVTWLPLTNVADPTRGTTYLLADRSVRVALTIPPTANSGPWQQVSSIVAATLPAEPVCTDGVLRAAAGES